MKQHQCSIASWVRGTLAFLFVAQGFLPSYAQQSPKYRTPVFDYSVSHRQSVCDRQQNFHSQNVTLRDALKDFELHPWLPYGLFSPLDPVTGAIREDIPGFLVEIMDELADRAQFTWRDSFGVSNPSERGNATFDELLQWTVQTYDISVAQWSRTLQRITSGASFPEGVYDASIIMVGVQESDSNLHIWSFLEPFEWSVWVMILVTFVVAGLVYQWMEWYNNDSDRQKLEKKTTETIFFSALTFTGQSDFQPSTDYARLFVFSLAFWSLLTASAYTANLASFLVVENTPSLQIETVGDAVRLNLPMCVLRTSAVQAQVFKAHPGARFVPKDSSEEVFLGVTSGQCTLAITTAAEWDEQQRNSLVNGGCKLVWIGRVLKFIQGGFATFSDSGTLCTSLIRDVFNLHLLEMEEEGFVQEVWEKNLDASGDIDCSAASSGAANAETDTSNARLSLQDMGGLFIVFYGLTAITICMALFSKRNHCKRRLCQKEEINNTVAIEQQVGSTTPESGSPVLQGTNEEKVISILAKLSSAQRELEAMCSLSKPYDSDP